jgi:hypothetical protein
MKRFLFVACLLLACTSLFAQGRKNIPLTTISGKLEWADGTIAVKSDGKTYYVSAVRQLIGFVDSVKEGASVTLEGRAFPSRKDDTHIFFQTTKLSLGGKDYDLKQAPARGGPQRMANGNNGFNRGPFGGHNNFRGHDNGKRGGEPKRKQEN